MNLLIAGDLVPTNINIDLFNNANIRELLGNDLLELWESANIKICNLETPLYDSNNPILKSGPNLKAPESTILGINALDISLLSLANNHIMDHGVEGMNSTIKLLEKNKINHVGIGENMNDVKTNYIFYQNKKKIGVYSCAQNEYSIASEIEPGANPFDPFESLDHIRELKAKCDYVIVLYHGGIEHYRYPSPYDQKVARKMVDCGANLVVFQHSHCVGCVEKYNESTIVYGQGNFLFNKLENEYWNNGILINLLIDDEISIEYLPIERFKKGIRLAKGKDADEIINGFYSRSKQIIKPGFVQNNYDVFVGVRLKNYLFTLSGINKWIFRLDNYLFKGRLLEYKYSKDELLRVKNYFSCESHRELIIRGINNKILKNKF